jgi:GT2 family glycosyltransferase
MMRLKNARVSPPGGFPFVDLKTQFKAHSWSINGTAGEWYKFNHEKLKNDMSVQQAQQEVEQYVCKELLRTHPQWQLWVTVQEQIIARPPNPIIEANISVIIPVYRFSERLSKVINSVHDQVNQVIVVHDKGTEIPAQNSAKVQVYTVDSEDSGFSKKVNEGVKFAGGEYFWFLNDDCYPQPGCAARLMEAITLDSRIGAVGHLLKYPSGAIQHGGTLRKDGTFAHRTVNSPSIDEVEAVTGASMLVRKSAFLEVNGFDESYFLYLEDTDFCLRLRRKQWKVFYTPYAEAIHEESASSETRSDRDTLIQNALSVFKQKSKDYFSEHPTTPDFNAVKKPGVEICYVHVVDDAQHETYARQFVDSVIANPPGEMVRWVIILNSQFRSPLKPEMSALFSRLGNVGYFEHDDSGWDIGAYQAYCKVSQADMCVFLGGSTYCRRKNWVSPMISAFNRYGKQAIYGACGNTGDVNVNVSPHLRTTGFWCAPSILNAYPAIVRTPQERYPFEHGPSCFTKWCWSQGIQAIVVDADGCYGFPDWNAGPNGYHRGNQSSLLCGDRLTAPPYYAYA